MRNPTKLAAAAVLIGCAVFTSQAQATTIGLTGGAPMKADGQTTVSTAGVRWMTWAGNQTATNPLVPMLRLRVNLRSALTLPALSASLWATRDEPWLNHVAPSFTAEQVAVIHAAGGRALTNQGWGMNHANWPTARQLAAYPGDILQVDSYPTAKHPLAEIGDKVALLHSFANGRPVWAVLQVCSRSNFATGKPPSAAREWAMAKAAIDNGATGIMFFGSGYQACFADAQDAATGFNWSAWRSTVLPTIRRIQAY